MSNLQISMPLPIIEEQIDWPAIFDELRQKESLPSDAKLAASLHVTRGYICSVRKGRKDVSLALAREIFSRLGKTFEAECLDKLSVPARVRTHMTNIEEQIDWPAIFDELRQKESLPSDAKLAASLHVTRGYICSVRKGRKGVSHALARVMFSRLGKTFEAERLEKLFVLARVRKHTTNLEFVRDYVISRANGHCQLCGMQAPFCFPVGKPYLELHHLVPPCEGGDDSPQNLVALCPNCHRKIELSPTTADLKKLNSDSKN